MLLSKLTKLLLKRKAVPGIRVKWFTDAELNPGSHDWSRKEIFERNGTRGDAIFAHPHFISYLWYFIHGARLPAKTIAGYCKILNEEMLTSGGMLTRLRAFVREQVRAERLGKREAAAEFYKLAIETGQGFDAASLRGAAMSTR